MPHDLDAIVATLGAHEQRATYSAVAAHLGTSPRVLMRGRPRAPENSWIVSKTNGRPTGYTDADLHPRHDAQATVLSTAEELAAWLATRG